MKAHESGATRAAEENAPEPDQLPCLPPFALLRDCYVPTHQEDGWVGAVGVESAFVTAAGSPDVNPR
jgi:hypothetical protein